MDIRVIYFLKNFFNDSLSLNFNYLIYPYTNLSDIDNNLRKGLHFSNELYASIENNIKNINYGYFYIMRDNYFFNYIFFKPFESKRDIISLGPYLSFNADNLLFQKIAEKNHLEFTELEAIREYIYQFPVFPNNLRLISSLTDILNLINPDAGNFEIYTNDLLEEEENLKNYHPIDNYQVYAQTVEKRYEYEEEMMKNVALGDATNALAASTRFLSMRLEQRLPDSLLNEKSLLYAVDVLLRKGAQRSEVHPLFLHQLSVKHAKLIDNTNSLSAIHKVHEQMIYNYCRLVKNKARIQYSPVIRNVLNHIEFNISNTLTLSSIAGTFRVSSPYLSKLFKNEVGINLTDYITNQRLHKALQLLTTTSMQIQEIAAYVGILDLNYFIKIFKKNIGCTPSSYRKKMIGTNMDN